MSETGRRTEAYPGAARGPDRRGLALARPAGFGAVLALPGALTVYLSFNSGGLFGVTTAVAVLIVAVSLLAGCAYAREPLAGFTAQGLAAAGLLALFALWTFISARWSGAAGRALVAGDRVLLYLGVLVLFICVGRSTERLRWILRGLLAGCAAVSLIGLVSRLLPSLWPTAPGLIDNRLSYPITYWNTFGMLAGVAGILAVHHASDEREPAAVRILAAALVPPLGVTLLLTFSRGAVVVTAGALLLYALVARPRGLPGALLAVAPTTAVAVSHAYSAVLVQEGPPLTPVALTQAHQLAAWVAGAAAVAAVLRALTLRIDSALASVTLTALSQRRARVSAALALLGVLVAAFVALHGPTFVQRQYDAFVNSSAQIGQGPGGPRTRLLSFGNDGRVAAWRVAYHAFEANPLHGTGAGTYQIEWYRQRNVTEHLYAYSIYAEVLGELGIVGIVLLGGALLAIVVALIARVRGRDRAAWAAALALVLAWLVHAGIDIDWETPAVSVFAFALGGVALARERRPGMLIRGSHRWGRLGRAGVLVIDSGSVKLRPLLTLACVGLAIVPARMAIAQTRLQESVDAINAGRCGLASARARAAISALDTGALPYEVLSMCAARSGRGPAAIRWARSAVAHDPRFWEPHVVLALAQAATGVDPRPQAAAALAENPLGALPFLASSAFRGTDARHWRAAAVTLPFALSG